MEDNRTEINPYCLSDDFFSDEIFRISLPLEVKNFCHDEEFVVMFKRFKELYNEYKPYVRVDLVMYVAILLMIFLYFIISLLVE